jgi:hypothetical protein
MTGTVVKLAAQLGSDDLVWFSLDAYQYCCSHCDKLFMLTSVPYQYGTSKRIFFCILILTRTNNVPSTNVRLCHTFLMAVYLFQSKLFRLIMNEEKRQKAASHHQTIGDYVSFICSMFIDPYD